MSCIPFFYLVDAFLKIFLALFPFLWYSEPCCDMIAMKWEVATVRWVFPWSECQEAGDQRQYALFPAGKPDGKSLYRNIFSATEQINV